MEKYFVFQFPKNKTYEESLLGASGIVQWVKNAATKTDDLNLIPGTHPHGRRRNFFLKSCLLTRVLILIHALMHT